MVVLVGWSGMVPGEQGERSSWWDGVVWCRGYVVVLMGWRSMLPGCRVYCGMVLGVQGVKWSCWDGGLWCCGYRVYGGLGGMEGSGAGGAGCMVVLVGWRGLVLWVQDVG